MSNQKQVFFFFSLSFIPTRILKTNQISHLPFFAPVLRLPGTNRRAISALARRRREGFRSDRFTNRNGTVRPSVRAGPQLASASICAARAGKPAIPDRSHVPRSVNQSHLTRRCFPPFGFPAVDIPASLIRSAFSDLSRVGGGQQRRRAQNASLFYN